MTNNDWNLYRKQFPTRYWKQGLFDNKLIEKLNYWKSKNKKINTGLDVGCGTLGTLVFRDFSIENNIKVDMLDPYVDKKPDWMRNKIDWDSNDKYDIIIARGSINYLNEVQIKKLKLMLSDGGLLIANTFLSPPTKDWSERPATNEIGEIGLERSRLVGNIVEHQIIFDNYKVNHTFFYYTKEKYEELFGEIFFSSYTKNSNLLIFSKDKKFDFQFNNN